MDYIDGHVHFWSDEFDRYPPAPGVVAGEMTPRRFLPEELLPAARASGVSRMVLIQMSYYGTDNRYMLDLIAAAPRTYRGIAVVDPRSREALEEMQRLAAMGVRGFRISRSSSDDPATWPESGVYDAMFEGAVGGGLAICPLIDPDALPALGRMCSRFPETRVVIDHMARIGMAAPVREEQVDDLCNLALFPEVRVKVSAFYALGEKRPPHLDLSDLIRRLCDAYGPNRLLWGSDCPFQIVEESYEDSIALVRDRLTLLTAEDREWLLRRTAEGLFFG